MSLTFSWPTHAKRKQQTDNVKTILIDLLLHFKREGMSERGREKKAVTVVQLLDAIAFVNLRQKSRVYASNNN